jgi:hypothetical protein
MAYKRTTISFGTTGVKSVSSPFVPVGCRITLGSKVNATDPCNHLSIGNSNGTTQSYHSTFSDGTSHQTKSGTNKIVSHYERVAGVLTEKVVARIDTVAAPWSATDIQFVVDTADANYQFHVEIWG